VSESHEEAALASAFLLLLANVSRLVTGDDGMEHRIRTVDLGLQIRFVSVD
jgi:hypothetical protein